jgi:TonB family protein
MQLTFTSAPSLLGISLAIHLGAFLAAGMHRRPPGAPVETTAVEIAIETEPPPAPVRPREEPVPNDMPAPAPVKEAPVHHEAPAVRGVAAMAQRSEDTPPAEATHAAVSDDALPHFAIATSPTGASGASLAKSSAAATTFEGAPDDDAPYAEGSVDIPARAALQVRPRYPLQARSSGIEGLVKLEIVLSSAGVVQSVRPLSHAGHGFEEEAIAAAWRTPFTPAVKHGRAVPVRMAWTVEFQLQ